MRCTQFWYEVLTSKVYEGRLLQRIARQVVQFGSGSWLRSIGRCIGEFGWQDLSGNAIRDLSRGDLRNMLWNISWRKVKDGWLKELNEKPKLSMLKMLVDCGVESSCAYVKSKSERRILMKLMCIIGWWSAMPLAVRGNLYWNSWKTLMMALTRRPRSRRLHPSSQMHAPTTNY